MYAIGIYRTYCDLGREKLPKYQGLKQFPSILNSGKYKNIINKF